MIHKRKSGMLMRQTAAHPLGRLTRAGLHIDFCPATPMPMRFWDTFALVYVLAGQGQFHDETGLSLSLRPGDLLLMFPGHGYNYQQDRRHLWSEFWLQFQGPIFDLWRQQKILNPSRPIYHLTPIEKWLTRFEDLVRPRSTRRVGHVLQQLCRLQELLADVLMEGSGRKNERPQNIWFAQATALLDKQPIDGSASWDAISAQMGISYDRFRKRFVQLAGVSPAKYLMARRLETACTMLQDRTLGLKEIARACGFCDVFHFSKRFKQGVRLTPTEYREHKLHGP